MPVGASGLVGSAGYHRKRRNHFGRKAPVPYQTPHETLYMSQLRWIRSRQVPFRRLSAAAADGAGVLRSERSFGRNCCEAFCPALCTARSLLWLAVAPGAVVTPSLEGEITAS
jgi:hypothetical protein